MKAIRQDLVEATASAAKEFWDRKLTPGGDGGDLSLRDPETGYIYILPKPSPDRPIPNWGTIGADYVAIVDAEGRDVGDNGVEPTVELDTHLLVYEARPEVNAIIHSHGEVSQIFAIFRWDVPTYTPETYFIGGRGPIKCAPTGGVATVECAKQAVKALGSDAKAALLPFHGAVCVGRDLAEAFQVAEMTERAARQAIVIRLMGGTAPMTMFDLLGEERMAKLHEHTNGGAELDDEALGKML